MCYSSHKPYHHFPNWNDNLNQAGMLFVLRALRGTNPAYLLGFDHTVRLDSSHHHQTAYYRYSIIDQH
jgi:hypothetical protein